MEPKPFTIEISVETLADLRARIRRTRWPSAAPGEPWEQGTDLSYLRELLAYWTNGFDWRERERRLNEFDQFVVEVDGVQVHYVHAKAKNGDGVPLILGHGWPSAFTELLPLVPLLTDPAAYDIEGPAFDVVVPSLPGYGFSARPAHTGVNYRYVAGQWHALMRLLGYERYGAGGGDFGAGVATMLGFDRPESVIGLHLTNLEIAPPSLAKIPPSPAENDYLADSNAWWETEGGYKAVQSTRPQTLGYGLHDSPAGLAAWIAEKWRTWTDPRGGEVDRDFLLELLTIYWSTETITTSLRDYFDNRWHSDLPGPTDRVAVPTAVAGFVHQRAFEGDPPRAWAERLYDVQRWTPMPRGGHFAPYEQPRLVAADIAAFFAEV